MQKAIFMAKVIVMFSKASVEWHVIDSHCHAGAIIYYMDFHDSSSEQYQFYTE